MQDHDFRNWIDRLKEAVPIEEVVQQRVPSLRASGASWKACCPFHEERNPSFVVTPSRGLWRCFSQCNKGGDVIQFVMEYDRVEFREAVELLAQQYGVPLPEKWGGRSDEDPRTAGALDALERAAVLYARRLRSPEGADARAYLARRGLDDAVVEAFGVGWAPADGRALVDSAARAGVDVDTLVRAGLARRREGDERPGGGSAAAYDFFRGRLTIPIRDLRGRVLGFGGRVLDGSEPKYINTAETPLFHKGRLVYGLDLARQEAIRSRHVVLVEGYTDVMAAHQVGVRNAAAVLGTATTADHARLLRRVAAERVTLVFDADEAGRKATARALEGLLPLEALVVDVVTLPEGSDPCDFLLTHGREAFERRVGGARSWIDFLADGLAGLGSEARAAGVDRMLALVALVPNSIQRDDLLGRLADRLDLRPASVRERFEVLRGRERPRRAVPTAPAPSRDLRPRAEGAADAAPGNPAGGLGVQEGTLAARAYRDLLGAVLLDNSLVGAYRKALERGSVPCPDVDLDRLLTAFLELHDSAGDDFDAPPVDAQALLTHLADDPARGRVVVLEDGARLAQSPRALADGAARRLDEVARRVAVRRVTEQLAASESHAARIESLADVDRILRAGRGGADPSSRMP